MAQSVTSTKRQAAAMITPPARVDEGDTLILEVACTAAAGVSVELVELRRAALAASTPGAD